MDSCESVLTPDSPTPDPLPPPFFPPLPTPSPRLTSSLNPDEGFYIQDHGRVVP